MIVHFSLRYRHPGWPLLLKSLPRQAPGELGVQAPVGFWDPLGLSADGDVGGLRQRIGQHMDNAHLNARYRWTFNGI